MRYKRLLVCLLFCHCAFALQTLTAADNGNVHALIAPTELNRIFVEGDRIKNVRGTEGQYILNQDNQNGQIYVKPTLGKRSFTLFLQTEQGKTFQVSLTPTASVAQTIQLKAINSKNPKALKWESSSSYEQVLVKLVTSMIKGESPDGYDVQSPKKAKSLPLGNIATLTLLKTYTGEHLQGEVYRLKNNTTSEIRLTEPQLYRVDTRAIAIENHVIPANSETTIFTVISHG